MWQCALHACGAQKTNPLILETNMSTINEIQDEIIEEFEGFTDWMDRYAYIIDLGNAVPPLD